MVLRSGSPGRVSKSGGSAGSGRRPLSQTEDPVPQIAHVAVDGDSITRTLTRCQVGLLKLATPPSEPESASGQQSETNAGESRCRGLRNDIAVKMIKPSIAVVI